MCPKFSAPGYLREADEHARDQEDQTEKATDRKRERSASTINDKPRKPQRKENDTNVPGSLERTHDRTDCDSSRFQGLTHPYLPIRSLLEPGSPVEQYKKWLSENPLRIHQIRPEIDKWREHFKLSKARPVALDDFDEAGTEIMVWWREFLIATK